MSPLPLSDERASSCPAPAGAAPAAAVAVAPAGRAHYEEDERAPFRPLPDDAGSGGSMASEEGHPYLSRELVLEIARATARTAGLRTYTWEETFGDGWRDRGSRFWDVRRPLARSDTTECSGDTSPRSCHSDREEARAEPAPAS